MKNYYDTRAPKPADIETLKKIAKEGVQLTPDSIISRIRFTSHLDPKTSFCINFESFMSSTEKEIPLIIDKSSAMIFDGLFEFQSVELVCKKDRNRLVVNLAEQPK
jgi:hypothetical protein